MFNFKKSLLKNIIKKLDENDGLFIELIDNTVDGGLVEINIIHDQYMTFDDIINLLPNEIKILQLRNKIKISINPVYIQTYEYTPKLSLKLIK